MILKQFMFSFDFLALPQNVWQESYFFGEVQPGTGQEISSEFNNVD